MNKVKVDNRRVVIILEIFEDNKERIVKKIVQHTTMLVGRTLHASQSSVDKYGYQKHWSQPIKLSTRQQIA
ncbi:hypothetical protein HanXRQr2_Chr12g0541701 [Helianthus annuus]|uniref:Uncharacterized protein n=1 Tax=Helianthus annuus TaxID=4232 RepID=A0A9K3HGL5_HELAN|nr:hypothetical protein HanXRQr2_Chr12g0541701 [Helianthus annuus]KAJ0862714.1 hypothetical protein HanPSC8_Chr12g0521511 [Helianthus annuus]